LGLSPATVSLVINRSPVANSIPQRTKDHIFAAVEKFSYRPNMLARSLRQQRTYLVGVMVPELSDGYSALVLSGVEDYLLQNGYAWLAASHRHKSNLIKEYPRLLFDRAIEGLILVDTPYLEHLSIPVVCVSGHKEIDGVTNIVLDHNLAATLALEHLISLGHRRIAFVKGQSFSSDTDVRWQATRRAAKQLSLPIDLNKVTQLEGDTPSPQPGYEATRKLLARTDNFTAILAFNDVSAIGAIRALQETGRRVPTDVSVVGFDDIYNAAFYNPSLSTIRQPLVKMGSLAAETIVSRIADPTASAPRELQVAPELVVRESSAACVNANLSKQTASVR
jgi:DNA-binding LacI/PurR family transcriptional regulator